MKIINTEVLYSQLKHSEYIVQTPIYQGPLDLLLNLIEKAELDISKVSLAKITDEYLIFINDSDLINAEEITQFLIIATKLIQIKSELLLPHTDLGINDEQDEGDLLIQQLKIYKKYKNVAQKIEEIESRKFRTYLRLAPVPNISPKPDLNDVSVEKLFDIYRQIIYNLPDKYKINEKILIPKITIKKKLKFITNRLAKQNKVYFHELLNANHDRIDIIVTFLAVLELIKQRIIEVQQNYLFAEIEIEIIGELLSIETLNLEFDD